MTSCRPRDCAEPRSTYARQHQRARDIAQPSGSISPSKVEHLPHHAGDSLPITIDGTRA